MSNELRCKIKIYADGKYKITDAKDRELTVVPLEKLNEIIRKPIKKVEVTPFSTYLEINSGLFNINGRWVWVP